MKFLFDLLPVILFFAAYKIAGTSPDASTDLATRVLGDSITASQAPILIATAVAILATLGQVIWLLARGRKVDTMLWISLALIVVFGGATLVLHDATFIKWKPTVLYWLFAGTLLVSASLFRRNLIRTLMEQQVQLPDAIWSRLNLSWIAFFAFMGAINLYVAFSYSEDTWVDFKLYGGMGLMLLFVIGQGLMLSRHIEETNS